MCFPLNPFGASYPATDFERECGLGYRGFVWGLPLSRLGGMFGT